MIKDEHVHDLKQIVDRHENERGKHQEERQNWKSDRAVLAKEWQFGVQSGYHVDLILPNQITCQLYSKILHFVKYLDPFERYVNDRNRRNSHI